MAEKETTKPVGMGVDQPVKPGDGLRFVLKVDSVRYVIVIMRINELDSYLLPTFVMSD